MLPLEIHFYPLLQSMQGDILLPLKDFLQQNLTKLNTLLDKNLEAGKSAIKALIAFKDDRKNSTIEQQNITLLSLEDLVLPEGENFPTKIELMELVRNTSYFVQRNLPDTFKDFLNELRTTDRNIFDEVTIGHETFLRNSGVSIVEAVGLFGASLTLNDTSGKAVSGRIALPVGAHNIVLKHGLNKDTTTTINTRSPIYFFKDAQLGTMKKPAHCIVMNQSDFELIKKTIHSGAFGGDYCQIEDNLVVVWKHPADLLFIKGYNPDPVPVDVGTYGFCDDTNGGWKDPPIQANATKMRIDVKEGTSVASVHQFVGNTDKGDKFNLPGISTGNFFNDFNDPKLTEIEKVTTLIIQLKGLGIYAFMSNASHHAVIMYAYEKEGAEKQPLTPNILATLLKDNPSILDVISKAALKGKDMSQWKNAFINAFINE